MVETLQIRRTPNNDTDFLIAMILTGNGTEFIAVNLDVGVARIVSEPEIEEQLPILIEDESQINAETEDTV